MPFHALALVLALSAVAWAEEPVETLLLEPREVVFLGKPVNPADARGKATFAIRTLNADASAGFMSCSATLIARDVLLTAAHCMEKGKRQEIVRYENGQPRHIRISRFVPHPRYQTRKGSKGTEVTHDIALAKLERPVPDGVVAKVPSSALLLKPGTEVTAMGYGRNGFSAARTTELARGRPEVQALVARLKAPSLRKRERDLLTSELLLLLLERPLLQTSLRATIVRQKFAVTPFLALEGEHNVCPGDSGGPSFLAGSEEPLVVGVHALAEISKGEGCSTNKRTGFLGVPTGENLGAHDTYVPFYSEWIEKEVKKLKAEQEI